MTRLAQPASTQALDAYFYGTHRLMHHPCLVRYFHRTHHRSVTPTGFARAFRRGPVSNLMQCST
jgi:sterol desaturase/sphingolipid hydroxylase (fatty acid hydroxylase superfamily)